MLMDTREAHEEHENEGAHVYLAIQLSTDLGALDKFSSQAGRVGVITILPTTPALPCPECECSPWKHKTGHHIVLGHGERSTQTTPTSPSLSWNGPELALTCRS